MTCGCTASRRSPPPISAGASPRASPSGATCWATAGTRWRRWPASAASASPTAAKASAAWRRCSSVGNLGLDQLRQRRQRILPAEVAHLGGDHARNPLLQDLELHAAGDLGHRHGGAHLAGQVRVLELGGVADAAAGHELKVLAAEVVAVAAAEVG